MARQRPDDVQKELKKQSDSFYGDDYVDGDPDNFETTDDMVEDVAGNKLSEGETMADEVEHDEEAIAEGADQEPDIISLEDVEDLEEEEKAA